MADGRSAYTVVLAFIARDGRVLLSRRPAGAHLAGLWEFPGGKVEAGETFAAALRREAREELGVELAVGEELAATRYAYPDRTVALHLFCCRITRGAAEARQAAEIRWAPLDALASYAMPPANAALLAALDR